MHSRIGTQRGEAERTQRWLAALLLVWASMLPAGSVEAQRSCEGFNGCTTPHICDVDGGRTAGAGPGACVGDCGGDGAVTVNELIKGVNVALGNSPVDDCLSFDTDGSGEVAVNELVKGVNNALNGCPPDTTGVLLDGSADMPALEAIHDLDLERGSPDSEIGTEGKGRKLIRTRIEIGLAAGATVGQVNALLDSINGRILIMLENVPIVLVRIPDPGDVAALNALVGRLAAEPIVRFVHKADLATPDVLPENFDPEPADPDFTKIDHHLAVRAAAAWNARGAIRTAKQPTLLMKDFFGGGAPSGGFQVRIDEPDDFATGIAPCDDCSHGYHVTGVIAASFGGSEHCSDTAALGTRAGRECATGMFPRIIDVRAVDLTRRIGGGASDDKAILILKDLAAQGVNAVLNTSLGDACSPGDETCVPGVEARQKAIAWIEKVRLSNLEERFLQFTAAGNIYPGFPDFNDPADDSHWSAAALASDLMLGGVPVANLTNILVIENGISTPAPPYEIGCLNNNSFIGGHLSAIGTAGLASGVWSLIDADTAGDYAGGTSNSTPQVTGLAAYVWALAPDLTPQQVAGVLTATARQDFSYILRDIDDRCYGDEDPAPTIDAYDAVLSVDAAALPDPTNAPVRLAILDVDADRDFDEEDIEIFLEKYIDPATGEQRQPVRDYSRYDLNGDDLTSGANSHGRFDLDREGSTQFGAAVLSTVLQNVGGDVAFDETHLTDLQILCYYAYSALFSDFGDEQAREEMLAGRCADVTVMVSPGSVTLGPAGSQQFSAAVRGTTDPRVTWSLPDGGGTITDTGLFSAGTTAGTFQVRATSESDPDVFGQAMVTIQTGSGGQVTFHQHEDFAGVGSIDTMISATITSANALACQATGMGMMVAEAPSGCNRPPEIRRGDIVECRISVFATDEVSTAFLRFEFSGTETHTACGQETVTQPYSGSLFARLEGTPIFTNGVITSIDFNRTTTNGNEVTVTTGIVELRPCTTAGCP